MEAEQKMSSKTGIVMFYWHTRTVDNIHLVSDQ